MTVVDLNPETSNVAGARLRSFVERIEHLEEEKKAIAEQIKEVFAEAKGEGFDVSALRAIIRRRKQDPDDVAEHEAMVELYLAAIEG